MLLTDEQANRLQFLKADQTGMAKFVYDSKKEANKKDLEYALELHNKLATILRKPFIRNIDELKKRLKEIEG